MCLDKLDWPVEYSGKKLVTMATQWVIRKKAARSGLFDLPPISPSRCVCVCVCVCVSVCVHVCVCCVCLMCVYDVWCVVCVCV